MYVHTLGRSEELQAHRLPRWLATPRAPPRPRGGENRAGERVPPLFVLEPTGPAGQRTKRPFFVPGGAGPPWHT